MFKIGSFEAELLKSMEKNLVSNQVEEQHSFNKLFRAADFLYTAAEIFEKAGLTNRAQEIEEVLNSLNKQLSNKK